MLRAFAIQPGVVTRRSQDLPFTLLGPDQSLTPDPRVVIGLDLPHRRQLWEEGVSSIDHDVSLDRRAGKRRDLET